MIEIINDMDYNYFFRKRYTVAGLAVHLFNINFILFSVKSGPLGHGEAFKALESAVVIVWATVPLEKEPFVVVTVIVIDVAS